LRLRSLEFRAYAVAEGLPEGLQRQEEVLELLAGFGFRVSPECRTCPDVEAAGGKLEKARQLEVAVIDREGLEALLRGEGEE